MNNINEQIAQIVKAAGFEGGLFSPHFSTGSQWDAHQCDVSYGSGYRATRTGSAETPEAAIAACMAAQWVLEKEEAK